MPVDDIRRRAIREGDPAGRDEPEAVSENVEQLGEDAFFVSTTPIMQKLRAQAAWMRCKRCWLTEPT